MLPLSGNGEEGENPLLVLFGGQGVHHGLDLLLALAQVPELLPDLRVVGLLGARGAVAVALRPGVHLLLQLANHLQLGDLVQEPLELRVVVRVSGRPRRLVAELLLRLLQGVAHVRQGVDDVLLDHLRVFADVGVVKPFLDAEHVLAHFLEDGRGGNRRALVLQQLDSLVRLVDDLGFLVFLLLGVLEVDWLGLLLRVLLDLGVDRLGGGLHFDLPGEHLVDASLEVGEDALELLLAELLQALLQLLAGFLQLLVSLGEIVARLGPLVLVEGAGGILLVWDGLANALGTRGLRLVWLWRLIAGLAAGRFRLAGRGTIARRALALAARGLIALRRGPLLVALVVFLVAALGRLVGGLVPRLFLLRLRLAAPVGRGALRPLGPIGRRTLRALPLRSVRLHRVVLVAVLALGDFRVLGVFLVLALRVVAFLGLTLGAALGLVVLR